MSEAEMMDTLDMIFTFMFEKVTDNWRWQTLNEWLFKYLIVGSYLSFIFNVGRRFYKKMVEALSRPHYYKVLA
jgi:hypothetical protein